MRDSLHSCAHGRFPCEGECSADLSPADEPCTWAWLVQSMQDLAMCLAGLVLVVFVGGLIAGLLTGLWARLLGMVFA